MSWRLKRADFLRQKGEGNKWALKEIVDSGEAPGIIAYDRDQPVAWCSFAPRESFPALQRSRTLARVDDQPVWSVVCFFILKPYRNIGVSAGLLSAVIQYVKEHGGKIIEGYPVEPMKGRWPDVFAWTGLSSSFRKAGFVEVQRRTPTRPIMRYYIEGQE
ncbi:MAG: GNAT family N-acetyltransferase [Bacteroidetes bacterium]|nr:GNAT family N-acetyltransferase [Bacteroidota bacterium]